MRCQGSLVEQTHVVYEKLRLTLEAAGASFADVVKTVDYIVPAARPTYRDTAAVRREHFGADFPAAQIIVAPPAYVGPCSANLILGHGDRRATVAAKRPADRGRCPSRRRLGPNS